MKSIEYNRGGRQPFAVAVQQIKELYPDLEIPDTPLIFREG
jgi:hypothetical protein